MRGKTGLLRPSLRNDEETPSLGRRQMANLVGDLRGNGRRPRRAAPPLHVDFHPEGLPSPRRADAVHGGRTLDASRMCVVEEHERLSAGGDLLDLLPQQAAILHDGLVGGAEMFVGAILDRAHRFDRPLVVHVDVGAHAGVGRGRLLVRIEAVIVRPVLARAIVRQLIQFETLIAHPGLVDRRRIAGEDRIPVAILVIHRHVPLRDGHLGAHRDHKSMREKLVGDADVGALLVDLAQRDQAQPVFGVFDIDDGLVVFAQDLGHRHVGAGGGAAELLAIGSRGILVLEEAVQERGMRRIDADLERLQPVAADVALERKRIGIGCDEAVDFRKRRRLAFAEIRPEDSALLDHGIRALLDALAQRRVFRLGGSFQALAGHVEQPAVERAAQAAVLKPPEGKVGAAMRAMAVDQAVTPLLVTKQHQILAEQFYGLDRARPLQLVDQRRRLPVHPHQFPARVLRPGPGYQVVLFLAHHGGASFCGQSSQTAIASASPCPGRSAARSACEAVRCRAGAQLVFANGPGSAERHEECRTASGTRELHPRANIRASCATTGVTASISRAAALSTLSPAVSTTAEARAYSGSRLEQNGAQLGHRRAVVRHRAQVALAAHPRHVLFRLGLQPDGVERRQDQVEGQRLGDDAAAGRQHHQFLARQQLPERGLLHAAKTFLAVERDDLGDRQSVLLLDLLVQLDKAPADLFREQFAERGFAGAAQADQGDAGECHLPLRRAVALP